MAEETKVKTGEVKMYELFKPTPELAPLTTNIHRAWTSADFGVVIELAFFLPLLQPGEQPPVRQIPAHTKVSMSRQTCEQMLVSLREMLDKAAGEGSLDQNPQNP